MRHCFMYLTVFAAICLSIGTTAEDPPQSPLTTIADTLDDFHLAAAEADGPRYFGHFADDAVFLGTDPDERWTIDEFRAFAEPYFEQGRGWTYTPRPDRRHIVIRGDIAWFDEILDNEKYGVCRGTGVLVRVPDTWTWKIAQYNLTFVIPNEVAAEALAVVKSRERDAAAEP